MLHSDGCLLKSFLPCETPSGPPENWTRAKQKSPPARAQCCGPTIVHIMWVMHCRGLARTNDCSMPPLAFLQTWMHKHSKTGLQQSHYNYEYRDSMSFANTNMLSSVTVIRVNNFQPCARSNTNRIFGGAYVQVGSPGIDR
jgi:hypothetical protein